MNNKNKEIEIEKLNFVLENQRNEMEKLIQKLKANQKAEFEFYLHA